MTLTLKPQLHNSALDLLSKCGQAFFFEYLDGKRPPSDLKQLRGIVIHRVWETIGRAKLAGTPMDTNDEALSELIEKLLEDEVGRRGVRLLPDDPPDEQAAVAGIFEEVLDYAILFRDGLLPQLHPTAIEEKWVIEIPGFPYDLAGTWDTVEESGFRDLKTRTKAPSDGEADNAIALTLYALAYFVKYRALPKSIALDILVRTPGGKTYVRTQTTTRTREHLDMQLRRVEAAARVIQTGVFMHATPGLHWWCGPKMCPHWDYCPFTSNPVVVPTGETA